MRLFFEWCPSLSRCGNMLPLEAMQNVLQTRNPGYRSVYYFEEKDANTIIASGSSAGFDRFTPYANELVMDFDDGGACLPAVEERLRGLRYRVYSSGGKGVHVVLPHDLIGSPDLPFSHRCWVEALGVPADLSLYRHGSLISLPGRIHPKTKRRKTLIKDVEGDSMTFEIKDGPKAPTLSYGLGPADNSTLAHALQAAANMAYLEPDAGQRHTKLWSAASMFSKAGVDFELTLAILSEVNDLWDNPKPTDELVRAVRQAYSATLLKPA